MKFVIMTLCLLFFTDLYGQVKKPEKKKSQVDWTWDGKKVTYSQLLDSIKVFYLKYCDSVSKATKKS